MTEENDEMDRVLERIRYLFKYKNSIFFQEELFKDEKAFLGSLTLRDNELQLKNKELLKELVDFTNIDLDELKRFLGCANFYNMLIYLYEVNTSIKNLLKKDKKNKNYLLYLIAQRKREGIFTKLNKLKFISILSLFSEILCISNITSGRSNFIISSNPFSFEYRKNGIFDLVLKQEKENLMYYFDIKRITLDNPLSTLDKKIVENKIKDLIENLSIKGRNLNRPLFLIIDCSDISVTELPNGIDNKTGYNRYIMNWNGQKIYRILKSFFQKNINTMPELKEIGGVGLFFWSIAVQKDKESLDLLFWHMPYTNLLSNYHAENKTLIEINNILFNMLGKEHEALLPNTGNFELLGCRQLK